MLLVINSLESGVHTCTYTHTQTHTYRYLYTNNYKKPGVHWPQDGTHIGTPLFFNADDLNIRIYSNDSHGLVCA